METRLAGLKIHEFQRIESSAVKIEMGTDTLNDDFASRIAEVTLKLIQQITPIVDKFQDESNEETPDMLPANSAPYGCRAMPCLARRHHRQRNV